MGNPEETDERIEVSQLVHKISGFEEADDKHEGVAGCWYLRLLNVNSSGDCFSTDTRIWWKIRGKWF